MSDACAPKLMSVCHFEHFSDWFGRSCVVDDDGTPKVVYHGTQYSIALFKSKRRNPDLGIHFGSLAQAEFFAGYDMHGRTPTGGTVIAAYLRIEHPLRTPDLFERGRGGAENLADWLRKMKILDGVGSAQLRAARSASEAYGELISAIVTAGYDGIVYENEHEGGTATTNEDSFVVFRPHQIAAVFGLPYRPGRDPVQSAAARVRANPLPPRYGAQTRGRRVLKVLENPDPIRGDA